MNEKILEMLKECGVPAHIKGYSYLKSAIKLCIEKPDVLTIGVTKYLYPTVAKEFSTTSTRVERAIRHAIEISFYNMPVALNHKLFGNSLPYAKGKATNSQFVATLAEYIKNELEVVV